MKDLTEEELEYVTRWLDHYHAGGSEDGVSNLGAEKFNFFLCLVALSMIFLFQERLSAT